MNALVRIFYELRQRWILLRLRNAYAMHDFALDTGDTKTCDRLLPEIRRLQRAHAEIFRKLHG